ncbi:MAG: hypothetical protein J2P41_04390 [Blastocatellia bacterium]|nr:hypothetical protein [Blastocatellia bacterium]
MKIKNRGFLWLLPCAAAGVLMAFLFDDSCQLDGGMHFLFAKWAWWHPELFVGVWSRPLYTFVYAFPALIGYRGARLFTVLVCLMIAWQTWRLAEDLKVERASLAGVLLWLQPSFFLFCADNMTEPIFALAFVSALRLHHRGWIRTGMLIASLLILARPEGFFLALLWALWNEECSTWSVSDLSFGMRTLYQRPGRLRSLRSPYCIPLVAGALIWWLSALIITGDPLYLKHNWPSNWPLTGTIYGSAGLLAFPARLPEIVGPLLLLPFFFGLYRLLKLRELYTLTSSFLLLFVLHTILRAFGLLGSAGYPRYLITVSPAIAIITLVGWNKISAGWFSRIPPHFQRACAAIIISLSAVLNFLYADGAEWSRDARALTAAHSWFAAHPLPINRLIWSEPYSCILFRRDPWENPSFMPNRENDLKVLRDSPDGTLVVWDERVGPRWYGLQARDFEKAGYRLLFSQTFRLSGYILEKSWFGVGGPRRQVIYLFYKP